MHLFVNLFPSPPPPPPPPPPPYTYTQSPPHFPRLYKARLYKAACHFMFIVLKVTREHCALLVYVFYF